MRETERLTVGAVVAALLLLVPAFVLHTSPRFAGSLAGFALGSIAAALMVSLLIYPLAKYSASFRSALGRFTSMRALLAFHAYAGAFGAFLAILHTGHKYQSPLGIALVISMLVVVVTGFVGRYYLPETSAELREAQSRLAMLRSAYDHTVAAFASRHASDDGAPPVNASLASRQKCARPSACSSASCTPISITIHVSSRLHAWLAISLLACSRPIILIRR